MVSPDHQAKSRARAGPWPVTSRRVSSASASSRLYYEFGWSGGGEWQRAEPSTVPTGVAVFPREIVPPIRRFAERTNRIVHWMEFDRGGHFAAMEEPDLLVADLRRFFRRFRDR
jgi:pimeloyl-ACP methyl ester carboxylesterase